jgi:PAS domain S-box-containing protein
MKRWFHNLKVAQKLMLISIFFVMPDTVMLYLFITGINANIDFARMEEKGNEYQRPLEALLELIPQHRLLAQRALGGGQPMQEEISRKQARIDAAFHALEAVDARIGDDLQFTDEGLAKRHREHYRVRTVRREWEDLKRRLASLDPAACAEEHLHLVADVRMMITHAGDLSNLILDPDLDSYYLMDATLLALPQTQDRLGEVIAHGATVLRSPSPAAPNPQEQRPFAAASTLISPQTQDQIEAVLKPSGISGQERQLFSTYATLLKESDLDRIRGSLQTALNEDPNFYGISPTLQARAPSALKDYCDAAEAFIQLTNRVVHSEGADVTPEEYLAAGSRARDASFKLWQIADEEVDTLLQIRIESYQARRAKSLLVAACALLAAIGFVTFITRSISGPLRQQADELRTANETLQAEIAERIRAEAELRRSEASLALAQRVARLGSWEQEFSGEGRIHAANQSWSDETFRIFGHEPDAGADVGELFQRGVHPDDLPGVIEAFAHAQQSGEPYRVDHRIVLPDGRERIVHEEADIIRDEHTGAPLKVIGTVQDITERHRSEEHRHAKEEAERANLAKSEFLSRMSHELRTPLNAILGFGQLLQMHSLNNEQQVSTEHIVRAGRHLLGLIDEVLDIARIESGHIELSLEAVNVGEVLRESLALIRPLAEERGIRVRIAGSELPGGGFGDAHVLADRQRFRQVLLNLLSNAVKYNADGGQVVLDFVPSPNAEGGRMRLRVADTGPGIAADKQARLFTPFDRLGAEYGKVAGTGLGLALCKRLVETMGGAIGLEEKSDPVLGRGAVFWVELPFAANPLPLGGVDLLDVDDGSPGWGRLELDSGKTLLYIEDNLSNLTLVEHLLTRFPEVRLLSAMQGSLGLDLARKHLPDLILLDVHLPDLPGWEVLARLQAEEATRDIPVVVISADATQRQIDRLTQAGARKYLTKPLDVQRFFQTVREFLAVQNEPSPV